MKLTVIFSDKFISIDNEQLFNVEQDWSWASSNLHAVQWYDTWGEVEYNDGNPNLKIEELGIFEKCIEMHQNEKNRLELKKKEEEERLENDFDHWWKEFIGIRNGKLYNSDWTQGNDSPLTEEQKNAWKTYRQELRDLPPSVTNPRIFVLNAWNQEDPTLWPVEPTF